MNMGRSIAAVPAILGIWEAGAAFVPLYPQDPPARRDLILQRARPAALIALGPPRDNVAFRPPFPVIWLDPVAGRPLDEPPASSADPAESASAGNLLDAPAYVIYTSGSTGKPKGVEISHRALATYCVWASQYYNLYEGCGAVVSSSLAFDLTISVLLAPLLVGQRVIFVPEEEGIAALNRILSRDHDLSVAKLTPSQLVSLNILNRGRPNPGAVRTLISGGEALNEDVLLAWRQHASATRIVNEYGPTETTVGCCVFECAKVGPRGDNLPIGQPGAGAKLYVLDSAMRLLPSGLHGEICIGGPGVAIGYRDEPVLTQSRFVQDPFSRDPTARLFRTGDIGFLGLDGHLVCEGRADDQIKLRGFRIDPAEIDAALRLDPAVGESAAVLNQEGALIGFVAPKPGYSVDLASLTRRLQEYLPPYMHPTRLQCVENLPRTSSGKIDRALLRQHVARPSSDRAAPRHLLDVTLCRILAAVLKVPALSIDDDYIELGGDSIRALEVIATANEQGLALEIADLFTLRTARRMADAIALRPSSSSPPGVSRFELLDNSEKPLVLSEWNDAMPASQLQLGMIFENEYHESRGVYHDIFGYGVKVDIHESIWLEAVARCVTGVIRSFVRRST